MTLPNFLVIGAAKAGTTSLHHYLGSHPDVFMCPIKEPNFFALEGIEPRFTDEESEGAVQSGRINDLASYERLFEGVGDERAIGEASPWYLNSGQAPDRIRHHIPSAKLIAVLRNPVERAYSAYRMNVRDGREPCSTFEEALAAQETRRGSWHWGLEFLGVGFYHKHLSRYYHAFSPEQIRVYLYEDLVADALGLISDVFGFLGVDPSLVPPNISTRYNVGRLAGARGLFRRLMASLGIGRSAEPAPMQGDTKAQLIELYREDILELQDLIDRDLTVWLRP